MSDIHTESAGRSFESGILLVRLRGGLGNQMFQYACGRALSHYHGRILLLDDSLLLNRPGATPRPYYLQAFNIQARLVEFKELRLQSNVVVSLSQVRRGFHEEVFQPIPKVPLVVLDGYWQSERYFESIRQLLQLELSFRSGTSDNSDLYQKISTTNSVCVHVRRADYLTPAVSHMVALGFDYYQRAISYMGSQLRNPYFFVFSDDISWCKEHLQISENHFYVEEKKGSEDNTIEDFRLMANCKHFIIANSTYSWWAAWLGKNGGKNITAPKNWYPGDPLPSRDIIPAGWNVL